MIVRFVFSVARLAFLSSLLLSLLLLPLTALACGVGDTTYAQAQASCQTAQANSYNPALFQCVLDAQNSLWKLIGPGGGSYGTFGFCGAPPPSCTAGQAVAPGTQVQRFDSIGETCSGGCSMALNAGTMSGGQWSGGGGYVLTGAACAGSGPGGSKSLTKPSETHNADGTTTDCDPISGKCVTFGTTAQTVPASSSSSANHSTDSTSTTSNPATTSTTSSTSTTTGDGTGGTGNGTTTTVTNGSTTTPASSSSTQSKCDTGVCDVGNADGDTGALYTAGTDSPSSVYSNFQAQVASSPIVSAATGFFSVSLSGTSCPTWHLAGNEYWGASGLDLTLFCDPSFLAILVMAGYIVLGVAAFCAFRIAIY